MKSGDRGFTLVESLIALVLLSLGLLGAWGLLLAGLRTHADAQCQAMAASLVRDMAERILANPRARALYASNNPPPADDACESPQPCDTAQRAAADLGRFSQAAHASLPGAATEVSVEFLPATGATTTDRYAITLRWRARRESNNVTLQLLAAPVAG
jgi:type IV pilus assembly protein PilV